MFCENCGNKLRDTAKFCPVCGYKVLPIESDFKPASTTTESPKVSAPQTAKPTAAPKPESAPVVNDISRKAVRITDEPVVDEPTMVFNPNPQAEKVRPYRDTYLNEPVTPLNPDEKYRDIYVDEPARPSNGGEIFSTSPAAAANPEFTAKTNFIPQAAPTKVSTPPPAPVLYPSAPQTTYHDGFDDYDYVQPRKSRAVIVVSIICVLAVLAAAGVGAFFIYNNIQNKPTLENDLTGMLNEAERFSDVNYSTDGGKGCIRTAETAKGKITLVFSENHKGFVLFELNKNEGGSSLRLSFKWKLDDEALIIKEIYKTEGSETVTLLFPNPKISEGAKFERYDGEIDNFVNKSGYDRWTIDDDKNLYIDGLKFELSE